jgi:hypothetical protein
MPGITGVAPINGFIQWDDPSADPFTLQGSPVNPAHGNALVNPDQPYPSEMAQWGDPNTQADRDGDYIDGSGAGAGGDTPNAGTGQFGTYGYDATPNTHAGPWPKGLPPGLVGSVTPDAVALQREESAVLHADGLTGSYKPWLNTADPLQDNWQDYWNPNDNVPNMQEPVNGQVKFVVGGSFSTDAVGNPDGHNENTMGNSHMHRRWSAGSVPGAYMWMKPGGRPLVGLVPGPARPPVGTGPFEGQDIGSGYQAYPGVLQHPAGAYEPPPDPYQPAALTAQSGLISADLTE